MQMRGSICFYVLAVLLMIIANGLFFRLQFVHIEDPTGVLSNSASRHNDDRGVLFSRSCARLFGAVVVVMLDCIVFAGLLMPDGFLSVILPDIHALLFGSTTGRLTDSKHVSKPSSYGTLRPAMVDPVRKGFLIEKDAASQSSVDTTNSEFSVESTSPPNFDEDAIDRDDASDMVSSSDPGDTDFEVNGESSTIEAMKVDLKSSPTFQ